MRLLFFIAATICCAIVLLANEACAATNQINAFAHTLTKEPAYQSTPKYCFITLENSDAKVWMVEDGRRLFVDPNANGDLTDDGPPLKSGNVRNLDAKHWNFICCYWEFYTTKYEMPKGVVPGMAKVSVELPAGAMPARLAKSEIEMPVVASSTADNQKR